MRSEQLDAKSLTGESLRVDFVRQGDRYGHRLVVVDTAGRELVVLDSVEGDASAPSPPSPPLQNLSIETLPNGRRVALLVGMAGRGHWSASIEALPGAAVFVFDIACRSAGGEPALASSYRLAAPSAARLFIAADETWIEARCEQRDVVISPAGEVAAPCALKMLDDASFAISPLPQKGTTIRWKYRVELLNPEP
jgi:hypothetical protein